MATTAVNLNGNLANTSKTEVQVQRPVLYFFLLNMRSIRSVITNPPTTLVVEHTTAMNPRTIATLLWCGPVPPAITIDPTSEMPEIAFVADIRGVCKSGGTREMT